MKRVLLTGASGFMGQHLQKRFYNPVLMDKKDGTSTADFGTLSKIVDNNSIDIIVHLGANCSSQISLREPTLDFTDNAIGTFNVLEIARIHNIPIIFNSTMKVYQGEDGLLSPYGLSKLVGEQYLKMYHDLYGVDYIINRPSSVYGPLQDASEDGGWFTWFIKANVKDEHINIYGDGTQSRDVLYIDDMVDLLVDQIACFDKYKNNDYDFGGGLENEVSLIELLQTLGHEDYSHKEKLKGDVHRCVCDNSKLTAVNNWRPKVHWRDGMEKTLNHERSSNI